VPQNTAFILAAKKTRRKRRKRRIPKFTRIRLGNPLFKTIPTYE
jgi:hypothetical protein